ncbi:MAG: hypothetical protein JO270_20965 [Acidobacteriaceae bacterium]|nr:hypothetical protein [Acidobacteriaceae bacterium]
MPQNLETLKAEMEAHLEQLRIAVFHGYHRMPDAMAQVSWDAQRQPDFRLFLQAALQAGAKLIVFHQQPFTMAQIDEALDQLEECELSREEKRSYETRLRKLQAYEGFTCSLELSFVHENRVFVFEQHTEWYESFADIVSEIEAAAEEEEDSEDGSLGSYFSNN